MSAMLNPLTYQLPLFPLGAVLFPGGLLRLRVFEARYLDLMSACIKTESPFGVVLIRQGSELRSDSGKSPLLENVGCLAKLMQWDMDTPGMMLAVAQGTLRFEVKSVTTQANGLIVATVTDHSEDESEAIPAALSFVSTALKQVIENVSAQADAPANFLKPYHFDKAGWVSNRWCEILPIPVTARQKLMELPSATARLEIVASFLKQRGIAA
jgi:uncharacterized protein